MRRIFLVLLLVLGMPAWAAPELELLAVPVEYAGNPLKLDAHYYRPEGNGPFPAIVLMHGCSGITRSHHAWARWLVERGYAVLIPDSFNPRGTKEVCTPRPAVAVSPLQRAGDARAAGQMLAARPDIDAARIGLLGFSHGGATTLFTMLAVQGNRPVPSPFAAAVAFYPDCTLRGRTAENFSAAAPLLILIGEADDWTLAARCRELLPRISGEDQPVILKTYEDAYHAFDVVGLRTRFRPDVANRNKPGRCCGATLGYNEPAFLDSQIQVESFFKQYLAPR